MENRYLLDYVNENEFKKEERHLKKYNMLAYRSLYELYYPSLREGNFFGKLVSTDKTNGTKTYELELNTDALFSKIHGVIKLYYIVYENEKIIQLDKLEPTEVFGEGNPEMLVTYKGVLVSKQHAEEDMFKINLLNMIEK